MQALSKHYQLDKLWGPELKIAPLKLALSGRSSSIRCDLVGSGEAFSSFFFYMKIVFIDYCGEKVTILSCFLGINISTLLMSFGRNQILGPN